MHRNTFAVCKSRSLSMVITTACDAKVYQQNNHKAIMANRNVIDVVLIKHIPSASTSAVDWIIYKIWLHFLESAIHSVALKTNLNCAIIAGWVGPWFIHAPSNVYGHSESLLMFKSILGLLLHIMITEFGFRKTSWEQSMHILDCLGNLWDRRI